MAMDKTVLQGLIKANTTAVQATPEYAAADAEGKGDLIWEAIADAIITHISTAAQITFRTSDSGAQVSTAPGSPTTGPVPLITFPAGQIS